MTEKQNKQGNRLSYLAVIAITAVITLAVAGGAAYFLGSGTGPPSKAGNPGPGNEGDRKIAYWRAPMNPTEIYDKPGKSAMGMDLVPVYEDELEPKSDDSKPDRKIAYWRAPMNPTEIYDKPGKSAMGMDLVPVYEDELVGGVMIRIDPVVQQNMGIRTAEVEKGPLVHTIRTYGHVTYDETSTTQISPKFNGWIEELYVDFTGKFVEKGEPLFTIYSPEIFSAQEEYLVAYRNISQQAGSQGREMLKSARRRLEYFDIPESEIEAIEKTGEVKKSLMIRSPVNGVVIHKNAVEGINIKAGTTIYTVADLSRVWVEAHIFEYELPWVKEGQEGVMTLPYLPGKVFSGRVAYVYPYLQQKTRDVIIRLEFENPGLALKPDMYADVQINAKQEGEGILIPSEAIIRSGERNIVFVVREKGRFTPRDITPGLVLDNGKVQVLEGLAPGDLIVTSGQFLLDSESKLKEAVLKMAESKLPKSKPRQDGAEADEAKSKEKEDFFKDFEKPEEDFFKDFKTEEKEDFFKDLETGNRDATKTQSHKGKM
jgi:Cu(I)/Ag(I) efflux system membrane fusion protein/cobalt-zinc-cadmium efflux system membrane fusion protein